MLQNRFEGDHAEPLPGQDLRVAELEREVAQLREALARRQQYGVVTGLLAVRFGLGPERTWELLVRVSQQSNLKMAVVARVIHDGYFGRLRAEDVPAYERVLRHLGGWEPAPVLAAGEKNLQYAD